MHQRAYSVFIFWKKTFIMAKYFGFFLILCSCVVERTVVATVPCAGSNTVVPVVVIPTSTYIYECQSTTLYLAMANVTFYGVDGTGAPQNVDHFNPDGTQLTVTPALSGSAAALTWDVISYNTCMGITSAQPTQASCQYVLQIYGFSSTQYLDYETLYGNDFAYQARIRLYRSSGTCFWQDLANVTVYIKDCNEYPVFDPSIPTTVSLPEYSGTSNLYAGAIANLLVLDPDVFNSVYGNVTLNVVSVTRPNVAGNPGVDPTPFYISGFNFLYTSNNDSALRYDVSRCPVVSTCLTIFDALYDNGGAAPYYSILRVIVQATDGGGLKSYLTINVNITQVPQSPIFLNLPATVNVAEDAVGPMQIYPIQITIPHLGTNTWSIQVLNVNPPVNPSGGTYIANSGACVPAPALPVRCNGLGLTGSVTGTTFDYMLVSKYNVTIWAVNIPPAGSGLTPVTSSSSIIVNITPMNKQPVLVPPTDAMSLTEDVATQACIYDLLAIPHDPNNDTAFYYNLQSITVTPAAATTAMWYLNGTKICYNGLYAAVGTCCGRVFKSTNSPYVISVQIKDAYATPIPYPTFTLTVSIIKVDDPPVLYAPLYATVPETWTNFTFDINATQNNPAPGTTPLVFNVTGFSATYNSQFFYVIAQNSTVNVGYGTIAAAGPGPLHFDFLTVPIIYVNVSVSDGIYTVQSTVIVYVQYVNRIPVVTNLPNSTSLLETTTGYAPFFTVSTTDKELDPRTFQFITPTGLSQTYSYFSIDFNLGIIYYINPMFNWFVANVYTLAVLVKDNPSPPLLPKNASTMANLTVSITMVDQPPTFCNPLPGSGQANSTISIYENVTGQAFIYTFNATDRESDTIYYNITSIIPSVNTAFNLPWGTAVLEYNSYYASTKPMFNHSIASVYWIVVEAKDASHMTTATSTTTLTVSIIHVDRPAMWTSLPGYVSIREDAYYGTDVYTVGAIDPNNAGYPVTISFIGITPSSGNSKFTYNTTTNIFSYVDNPQFSYGVQNSYTALFTASNTITPVMTSSIAINIYQINTGPYNNNSLYNYTVWLREDTKYGQLLWDLRTRSNLSLSLNYVIQDCTPSTGAFIVTTQGLVKVVDQPNFNYQRAPSYVVKIVAIDTGLGLGQQAMQITYTMTVSITPVAKNPVITNLPNFVSIREGYPGAGNIYLARCTDPSGNSITWNYNVLPMSAVSYFTVAQNGTISTTQSANFTYLNQPQYLVVVMCGNSALTTTATLTVAIVWTTSTTTTTTTRFPPVVNIPPQQLLATDSPSTGLTSEQIGAIAGSLGGALVLAGLAYGLAQIMRKKAERDGTAKSMTQPVAAINEINLDIPPK